MGLGTLFSAKTYGPWPHIIDFEQFRKGRVISVTEALPVGSMRGLRVTVVKAIQPVSRSNSAG